MKRIGQILLIGLAVFICVLLLDQQGRLSFKSEPKQDFVTVKLDSSVTVHNLHPKSPNEVVDSIHIPDFTPLKTQVDSDSVLRYDLTRHEQAVVTIDLDEHKEAVFFTLEDMKAYFSALGGAIEQYINK